MAPAALLLATALVAADVFAQREPQRRAPDWSRAETVMRLSSPQLAEVAWAGWLVRRRDLRAAIPTLRHALARLRGRDDDAGQFARLHLVDALITFAAELPADELLPHAVGRLRVPVLVLASRSPDRVEFLRTRMWALRSAPDLEWLVCGTLLATHDAPALAAACVQDAALPLQFTVQDPPPINLAPGMFASLASPWRPPNAPPRGGGPPMTCVPTAFPPLPHYQLLDGGPPRAPFRTQRTEEGHLRPTSLPACSPVQALRFWFPPATGAGVAWPDVLLSEQPLRWTGASALRADVTHDRCELERAFRTTVAGLRDAGVLTAQQAGAARPRVRVSLTDWREVRSQALPDPTRW